jgi:hypothetical protein
MHSRPQVTLLGCYHQIQRLRQPERVCNNYLLFEKAIDDCLDGGVTLVCEEAGDLNETLAASKARSRALGYFDLDIPKEAKALICYVREGEQAMNDDCSALVTVETWPAYRKAWGLVREFHMSQCFDKYAQGHSYSLLVCGIAHLRGLTDLLVAKHFVTIVTPAYELQRGERV